MFYGILMVDIQIGGIFEMSDSMKVRMADTLSCVDAKNFGLLKELQVLTPFGYSGYVSVDGRDEHVVGPVIAKFTPNLYGTECRMDLFCDYRLNDKLAVYVPVTEPLAGSEDKVVLSGDRAEVFMMSEGGANEICDLSIVIPGISEAAKNLKMTDAHGYEFLSAKFRTKFSFNGNEDFVDAAGDMSHVVAEVSRRYPCNRFGDYGVELSHTTITGEMPYDPMFRRESPSVNGELDDFRDFKGDPILSGDMLSQIYNYAMNRSNGAFLSDMRIYPSALVEREKGVPAVRRGISTGRNQIVPGSSERHLPEGWQAICDDPDKSDVMGFGE